MIEKMAWALGQTRPKKHPREKERKWCVIPYNTIVGGVAGAARTVLLAKDTPSCCEYKRPPWNHKYEGKKSWGYLLGRRLIRRSSSQWRPYGHHHLVRRMRDQKSHGRPGKLCWYIILGCLLDIVSQPGRPKALQGIVGWILGRTCVGERLPHPKNHVQRAGQCQGNKI